MGAKPDQRELKMRAVNEIVARLIEAQKSGETINLNRLKCDVSSKLGMDHQPKLVEIIAAVPEEYKELLLPKLKAKPVRTASGIAVVAVMSKPHRCPHINFTGNICVYCPGGPDSDFEYSTQSYTGYEPTSMRAIRARYNPYIQTINRLAQLKQLGHNIDKVEFIVMGGTFMSLPKDYRDDFISKLHDALSGHSSSSVVEAVKFSEVSDTKCIGITIETRPDYCLPRHMDDMLLYGCTRLEIGVQSVYEDVARDTNRGHTVKAVCETFHMAKDTGYKVVIHMMPNLPNVPIERDLAQFVELFENPDFRPDGLKLYPTLVIRSTGLYELWRTGRYKSYPPQVLVDLVAQILALVPPWTRVYRVQRDIPMPLVSSGVEYGNLREHALARMNQLGLKCRDVRTREVGIQEIHQKIKPDQVELVRRDYTANGGWETFITYEDVEQDILIGLLRLRKCTDKVHRPELKGDVSVVRELHVYGTSVPVASRDPTKFQHQGYGQLLMEEAERIAREEHGSTKLAVISGVGTRHYYRMCPIETGWMTAHVPAHRAPASASTHLRAFQSAAAPPSPAYPLLGHAGMMRDEPDPPRAHRLADPPPIREEARSPGSSDGKEAAKQPVAFECSHVLDLNSLRALHHDDDEDQMRRTAPQSSAARNRLKQEALKKFVPGEPCVVCGDAASGIHYSVSSCNGCKTFFRRVLIENRTYSCKGNGNCPIDKDMRCSCRHCRFKKCLQVGMDCTELNIERRRKRKIVEQPKPEASLDEIADGLVRELVGKERVFLKMLTSTVAPIHATVDEAFVEMESTFNNPRRYEENQMSPDDQMNFSYWRAKILSTVIEWAKSFPEFQQLGRKDQEALVVHSSFSNLVLSEAFHTPERFMDRIVFPDGLSGFRNLTANILRERSGLIPTVVAVINNILVPIRKMRMTEVEYVLLQAIIFFDRECISLSEECTRVVHAKRKQLLESLRQHVGSQYSRTDSALRFASLLLRISNVNKVAAFKRETLCTIETFNLMSPHPLTMEISKKYPDTSFF